MSDKKRTPAGLEQTDTVQANLINTINTNTFEDGSQGVIRKIVIKYNTKVFRTAKLANFTVMSNDFLQDNRLSAKAKGMLAEMLSLPDDWKYSVAGLCTLFKDGRKSIESGLKELEQYGYLKRSQLTDERGRFMGNEYIIYESLKLNPDCAEFNPQMLVDADDYFAKKANRKSRAGKGKKSSKRIKSTTINGKAVVKTDDVVENVETVKSFQQVVETDEIVEISQYSDTSPIVQKGFAEKALTEKGELQITKEIKQTSCFISNQSHQPPTASCEASDRTDRNNSKVISSNYSEKESNAVTLAEYQKALLTILFNLDFVKLYVDETCEKNDYFTDDGEYMYLEDWQVFNINGEFYYSPGFQPCNGDDEDIEEQKKQYIEAIELMVEMSCDKRESQTINSQTIASCLVRNRMMNTTFDVFEYAIDSVNKASKQCKIGNIKAYMRTALYNAKTTYMLNYSTTLNSIMCNVR